jgi:hypothetical protein
MKKKIICISIFLILVTGLFIFNKHQLQIIKKNSEIIGAENRKLSVVEELKADFKSADPDYDVSEQNFNIWWNDAIGYSFYVTSTQSFVIAASSTADANSPDDVVSKLYSKEITIAKQVFAEHGYAINTSNTIVSIPGAREDKWGYEKGKEFCTIEVRSDYESYGGKFAMAYPVYIACGNTLAQAEAEQRPFLDALNYKGRGVIGDIKKFGLFYVVSTWDDPDGEMAILKKEDNGYQVLWTGYETPTCSIYDKNMVSNTILNYFGGCYENSGILRKPSSTPGTYK